MSYVMNTSGVDLMIKQHINEAQAEAAGRRSAKLVVAARPRRAFAFGLHLPIGLLGWTRVSRANAD